MQDTSASRFLFFSFPVRVFLEKRRRMIQEYADGRIIRLSIREASEAIVRLLPADRAYSRIPAELLGEIQVFKSASSCLSPPYLKTVQLQTAHSAMLPLFTLLFFLFYSIEFSLSQPRHAGDCKFIMRKC